MTRWLRAAESIMDGTAQIEWRIKKDEVADDPQVREILADVELTRTQKETKVKERVEQMLDDQVALSENVVIQGVPERGAKHIDDKEIEEVISKYIEESINTANEQLYTYLLSLGIEEGLVEKITDETLYAFDKNESWETILKRYKIEIDATIADIINHYSNLTK